MHGLYSAILKSLTSRYALYGAQITSVLVLARIFEPRDFGVLAAVQVFVVLFQMLAEGGLGPAIISRDKITPEDRDGIFSATVLIGLCMAVCFAILGPALQAFYKMEGISTVALILSMSLIPTAALTFPQAALLKEQFYFRVSAAGIIAEALSLFLVFGLHRFSGLAPIKMLSLKTLTMASMNFLCLYAFSSKTTTGRPGPSRRISAIRPLLSFSLYQFGFNLLVFSSRNTDNILVGKFMSAGALGIYDRAYQLMRYPLMLLTFAMTPAIQPMLRKHASDSVYIENVHRSFTLRLISPARMILAARAAFGTTPACFSTRMSMSSPGNSLIADKRTSTVSPPVNETKPRLGRRRCSGIWPPSKPILWKPPERAFCPLWPRPAVLPVPLPTPRPTRFLACLEPAAGLIWFKRIYASHFSR